MKHAFSPCSPCRASRLALFLVAVVAFSLTTACGSRPQPRGSAALAATGTVMTPRDRARLEAIAQERAQESAGAGYLIGADDLLQVHVPDLLVPDVQRQLVSSAQSGSILPVVAQAPVFQEGLRVDGTGKISLPLVGEVTAEGKTPGALEAEIASRLTASGILRAPQVSVQVVEYRNRVAAVVGSVERPGLYPLTRPGATIADLLWAAGGPTKEAGRVVEFAAAVKSKGDGDADDPIRIDLESLLHANGIRDRSVDPPARPGDVITLSPAGSVHIEGWVTKPGSYPVTRGLTVSGAVAAAGGKLFPASSRHATMSRVEGSSIQRVIPIDLHAIEAGEEPDLAITDGDVIRVPVSPPLVLPWGIWQLVLNIVRLGGSVAAI